MPDRVELRAVQESDFAEFFEQQRDPEAVRMAAFPARDRDAHMAHWKRITADPTNITRTISKQGKVAGHIASWKAEGKWHVGYWVAREFWGQGVATEALRQLLSVQLERPLFAHVAVHNVGSIRVLEKCGFRVAGRENGVSLNGSEPVDELIMTL